LVSLIVFATNEPHQLHSTTFSPEIYNDCLSYVWIVRLECVAKIFVKSPAHVSR
jgi:hypothetical protein